MENPPISHPVVDAVAQLQAERDAALSANKLPSRFQLDDLVRVSELHGSVTGICFRAGKVFYEVGGVMHPSDDVAEPLRVEPAEKP